MSPGAASLSCRTTGAEPPSRPAARRGSDAGSARWRSLPCTTVSEGDREGAAALDLIDYYTPLLLRLCIDAGVIAAFGRDERSLGDVAVATGTHAGTLARVVRALESRGVFERGTDARFRLPASGRTLLPDQPGRLS